MEQGYRIVPVNPTEEEVLGESAYETVDEIPEQVDVGGSPSSLPKRLPRSLRMRCGPGPRCCGCKKA